MSRSWQLQEAKNKFSEVVAEAQVHGPQIITRHGVETAIVISYDEFQKLQQSQKPLSAFFQESPLVGVDLNLTRDSSKARSVDRL